MVTQQIGSLPGGSYFTLGDLSAVGNNSNGSEHLLGLSRSLSALYLA